MTELWCVLTLCVLTRMSKKYLQEKAEFEQQMESSGSYMSFYDELSEEYKYHWRQIYSAEMKKHAETIRKLDALKRQLEG
jgi:hypothetical protein